MLSSKTALPIRAGLRSIFHAILLLFFVLSSHPLDQSQAHAAGRTGEAHVLEVNDGDTVTLRMDDKTYRTRLIGIDAPELDQRPWGYRAKDHLIEIMTHTDWTVYVETDIVKHDKYDRLLAYLWTRQKELINEWMVLDGHAVLFTIPPNVKYANRFARAEKRARQEKKGIWEPKGLKESPFEYRKKHPRM
jgi:micrococcal nuclease